jgi:hypothetical protein
MKKTILSFALFISLTSLSAQTKKIAHRSHSGKNETFRLKSSGDNFGLAPGNTTKPVKDPNTKKTDNTNHATSVNKNSSNQKSKKDSIPEKKKKK